MAGIGLVSGAGDLSVALGAAVLAVVILNVISYVERAFHGRLRGATSFLLVTMESLDNLAAVLQVARAVDDTAARCTVDLVDDRPVVTLEVRRTSAAALPPLLLGIDGVRSIDEGPG